MFGINIAYCSALKELNIPNEINNEFGVRCKYLTKLEKLTIPKIVIYLLIRYIIICLF